jgi:hypothetical protein
MAAYFLCAAILLPELDALVFHGAPAQESRVHIEATGTATCHAESCVLGANLPRGQRSEDLSPDIARLSAPAALTPTAVSSFADRTPPGTCTPRAPPTISAS